MLYDVLRNCHCPKTNITLLENSTYSFLVFEIKDLSCHEGGPATSVWRRQLFLKVYTKVEIALPYVCPLFTCVGRFDEVFTVAVDTHGERMAQV